MLKKYYDRRIVGLTNSIITYVTSWGKFQYVKLKFQRFLIDL